VRGELAERMGLARLLAALRRVGLAGFAAMVD